MDKNSKIIVTGVKGQLGFDCLRRLKEAGYTNVLGIDIEELDITDEQAVHSFIERERPDVFMHNAAWTAVDKAEQMPELVNKVNALGPKYIAEACKKSMPQWFIFQQTMFLMAKAKNSLILMIQKTACQYMAKLNL